MNNNRQCVHLSSKKGFEKLFHFRAITSSSGSTIRPVGGSNITDKSSGQLFSFVLQFMETHDSFKLSTTLVMRNVFELRWKAHLSRQGTPSSPLKLTLLVSIIISGKVALVSNVLQYKYKTVSQLVIYNNLISNCCSNVNII